MTTRNTNARFELAPQVNKERSTFDRSCNVKTSFDVGELIPFYVDEVLPGDTFEIKTSKVTRLQTLLTPVMDNLYLDTYYFFVPNRLVWSHWKEFMGENSSSAWIPSVEYTIPQVYNAEDGEGNGWEIGTIADYMGVPVLTGIEMSISALPFRAYAKIVDDWFRDENLQQPVNIPTGDSDIYGSNGDNYITDLVKGGKPFIACKYHDYFTSCLPAPQKGPEVNLLSELALPVVTQQNNINASKFLYPTHVNYKVAAGPHGWDADEDPARLWKNDVNMSADWASTIQDDNVDVYFPNLIAKGTPNPSITVNALREAFAIQRFMETSARFGTRYIEQIRGHFGVESPDARLQRSEYLGGNRVPFNIEQVTQTSSTDSTSPIGSQAGWSQTNDYSEDVRKSFTEHGYIIGLMCARYDHTYQQGIEKHWNRRTIYDFYWPEFAHIGEQPVYKREIDATMDMTDRVFGYQEAWAEYRYKPNYVTGQMRSQANGMLDSWHFADYYSESDSPTLSAEWIQEDKSNVDRCLAITSEVANQIFADIMLDCTVTRPMPLYSIPGLIDHF